MKYGPLTEDEKAIVFAVALARHEDGWAVGREDPRSAKSKHQALQMDVIGAAGEYVVSTVLKLPWNTELREFKGDKADLEPNVEVKTSSYRSLTITDQDIEKNPDRPHVGVWFDQTTRTYELLGFIQPKELLTRDLIELPGGKRIGLHLKPEELHQLGGVS